MIFLRLPDLSSYVPKHSVDFSSWQEHKHDDGVHQEDAAAQTTMTEEVMVSFCVSLEMIHVSAARFLIDFVHPVEMFCS